MKMLTTLLPPTSGTARVAGYDIVRAQLRAQDGTTIVFTTHLMEEADRQCSRVAILHRGRVVALGTPAALKAALGGEVTLDEVFVHYAGGVVEEGGEYRETTRTRQTARRLG
jgi:ABC-2 type transport system ATP-binding protein